MRFYDGSFDALIKAAKEPSGFPEEKMLFILPEVNNRVDSNAIMLSNGKQKLGSVAAIEAAKLRGMFDRWKREKGYDEVVVATFKYTPFLNTATEIADFRRRGSIVLTGVLRVHERLARKFAKQS